MMQALSLDDLLQQLAQQGVQLWVEAEQLRVRAPQGVLTADLRATLTARKLELLARLSSVNQQPEPLPTLIVAPEERHEPFPLTDIQFAYWIGQTAQQELRNGYHAYTEYACQALDTRRLRQAWQKLIDRHDMLRSVVLTAEQQQILPKTAPYLIQEVDISNQEEGDQQTYLHALRKEMSHQVFDLASWPLFDIRVTRLAPDCFRLHISLALILLDGASVYQLLQEWNSLYQQPTTVLAPLQLSYRDYVVWERSLATTCLYEQAHDYWRKRIETLPPAPDLPVKPFASTPEMYQVINRTHHFASQQWQILQQRAQQAGITLTALLVAVFAETLAIWCRQPQFTLNLTLFNRPPVHPQINEIVGDFTTVNLLAIDTSVHCSVLARAQQIQRQLWTDLEHRYFPGVLVIRELARKQNQGGRPLMPIVFTSLLGLNTQSKTANSPNYFGGEAIYAISQTPQVLFDHHVKEVDGKLVVTWDTADAFFPDGLLDDLFVAYCQRIDALANAESEWHVAWQSLLPADQAAERAAINATDAPFPNETLPALFLQQVKCRPNALAIYTAQLQLSYQETYLYANQIGHWLRQRGAKPNQLVAILMEKGWEQIVGVLGILLAGAAYLPIDPELPAERQTYLLENGEVELVLTQTKFAPTFADHLTKPRLVQHLCVDALPLPTALPPLDIVQTPRDLAYVLYTSGSTGKPKGVMIEQRSVVNRMVDVVQRFQLKAEDRVLALTALHHDLSVFDIFAMLTIVGGALVLPTAEKARNPAHWAEVINQGRVTLWNSVPAFMQMLLDALDDAATVPQEIATLRWVILSGDFIPVALPDRLRRQVPGVEIISAGGPTETTVWDICYPITKVDPGWISIPYGKPMHNARYYVLKENLEPCPTWVEGELYIAGVGLARGYWRDPERTNTSFISHPQTGQRLYRSGDLGRYLPNGNIEILGRRDFQVKLRGQRVELGEIEAALHEHPTVKAAIVNAVGDPKSFNKQLIAYVVRKNLQPNDNAVHAAAHENATAGVLSDPIERTEFKLRQHGLRPVNGEERLRLPPLIENDARHQAYLTRQSYRQYGMKTIPAEEFSTWLGCLAQMHLADIPLPKYRYPSAGGLYPVQTYLYSKPDRIGGITGGFYYYHPAQHELVQLCTDQARSQPLFSGINQPIFDQAAFALFFVGELRAIAPMYGELARDFCLLEAGYMSQLLMMQAPEQQLGLCPIGGVEEVGLRQALKLAESQLLLHSLVGGSIEPAQMTHWLQPGQPPPSTKAATWQAELRSFLQAKLPAYMLPTTYVELDTLPLSANGKVNRQALPLPEQPHQLASVELVAPRTPLEAQIAEVWGQVLTIEQPSVEQDFFESGGDSLLATRLLTRLRQSLNVDLSLRTLFTHPTIAQLAGVIEAQALNQVDPALLQAALAELEQA